MKALVYKRMMTTPKTNIAATTLAAVSFEAVDAGSIRLLVSPGGGALAGVCAKSLIVRCVDSR